MSAIAGIFNVDGRPVSAELLHAMSEAGRERGPGADGYWTEGAVGMAFRLLTTTPEVMRERQPWSSDDGNIRMVFDGRIDNRSELADAIQASRRYLDGPTDVELVGRCFEMWGEGTWNRLIGDFAIVAMNRRQRKMFCARDPMGFKPLHYFFDGRKFLLASDLIQILQDPQIARTPNEAFLAECLAGGPFTRHETVIRNVLRLEGGACLTVDGAGVTHRQYYDLAAAKPIRFATYDDCAAALREVLFEAVRCRMRAPGDVASHLSGGLDSSSIVCIAHELSRRGAVSNRVKPFSMIFADPDGDETEFISEVEQHLALATDRCVPFEPDAQYLTDYARKTLEVPRYPNATMHDGLDRRVVARGLRVCLGGHGGDNTMYGSTDDLAGLLRGAHLIRFVRALRDLRENTTSGDVGRNFMNVVFRSAIWPLVPAPARKLVRRACGRDESPSNAWRSWIDHTLSQRYQLEDRARAAEIEWDDKPLALRAIWYLLYDGWLTYGLEGLERSAARAGLEYRYPFCDRRVTEFMCGLAEEQRWNQGAPRLLMRRAMRGVLPERVRTRTTKAFFDNTMMRVLEKIRDSMNDRMTIAQMGWVSQPRLREAIDSASRLYRTRDSRYTDFMWTGFAAFGVEILMHAFSCEHARLARILDKPALGATGTCL
jgi:asparagine synthase (glutamine-hydrolysing)